MAWAAPRREWAAQLRRCSRPEAARRGSQLGLLLLFYQGPRGNCLSHDRQSQPVFLFPLCTLSAPETAAVTEPFHCSRMAFSFSPWKRRQILQEKRAGGGREFLQTRREQGIQGSPSGWSSSQEEGLLSWGANDTGGASLRLYRQNSPRSCPHRRHAYCLQGWVRKKGPFFFISRVRGRAGKAHIYKEEKKMVEGRCLLGAPWDQAVPAGAD